MKKVILYPILAVAIASCGQAVIDDKVVGRYRVVAPDVTEQASLVYDCGDGIGEKIVSPTVLAVGYNDRYIVVQQYPFDTLGIDSSKILYFIVPQLSAGASDTNIPAAIGPMSRAQFELKIRRLGIETIEFTKSYKMDFQQ